MGAVAAPSGTAVPVAGQPAPGAPLGLLGAGDSVGDGGEVSVGVADSVAGLVVDEGADCAGGSSEPPQAARGSARRAAPANQRVVRVRCEEDMVPSLRDAFRPYPV